MESCSAQVGRVRSPMATSRSRARVGSRPVAQLAGHEPHHLGQLDHHGPVRRRHLLAAPQRDRAAPGQHPEVAAGVVQRLEQLRVRLDARRAAGAGTATAGPPPAPRRSHRCSSASASSVRRARASTASAGVPRRTPAARVAAASRVAASSSSTCAASRAGLRSGALGRDGGHQQGQDTADHRVQPAAEALSRGSGARVITITDCTQAWMIISCRDDEQGGHRHGQHDHHHDLPDPGAEQHARTRRRPAPRPPPRSRSRSPRRIRCP